MRAPSLVAQQCFVCLQITVQSWRLGWNFTDGEVLAEAADYFPNTSYPLPGSVNTSSVEIQSTALSASNSQQAVQNAWFYPSQVCLGSSPALLRTDASSQACFRLGPAQHRSAIGISL